MSHKPHRYLLTAVTTALLLLLIAMEWVGATSADAQISNSRRVDSVNTVDLPIAVDSQAAISTTTNFLLFEQAGAGDSLIRLLTDGLTETTIITGHRPRLSPDGKSIVYLAGDTDPVRGDIYIYDIDTDTSAQIFSNWDSIVYYTWTPDGTRIIYDFRCKIYEMDPDGSNNQELVGDWINNGIDYCYNDHPDANPTDGRLIWENERYGLALANADGSDPAWIPNTQPRDYFPRWSPDGKWIAFFRDSDAEGDDNFFKIRPDGSDLTQLTYLTGDVSDEMEQLGGWSVDGNFVVGAGEVGGTQGLYAVDATGSGLIVPLLKRTGADKYFVGNAGILDIELHSVFLPLVIK